MRYYHCKQRYLESAKFSKNASLDRTLEHIEDRVELSDTTKFKREMMEALKEYTDLKTVLKNLEVEDGEE